MLKIHVIKHFKDIGLIWGWWSGLCCPTERFCEGVKNYCSFLTQCILTSTSILHIKWCKSSTISYLYDYWVRKTHQLCHIFLLPPPIPTHMVKNMSVVRWRSRLCLFTRNYISFSNIIIIILLFNKQENFLRIISCTKFVTVVISSKFWFTHVWFVCLVSDYLFPH